MRAIRITEAARGAALLLGIGLLLAAGCGGGDKPQPVPIPPAPPAPPAAPTAQVAFGPLAGATLELFEVMPDGTFPLLHTQVTSSGATLAEVGIFDPIPVPLTPAALYLYKASGGSVVDADDDGVLDPVPTPMQGAVHALIRGSEATPGGFTVNVLTEILYRRVYYMLAAQYPQAEILAALDEMTLLLLGTDVDGVPAINAADALAWDPATDRDALRKDWTEYENIHQALRDGDDDWVGWEVESVSDASVALHFLVDAVQDVHVIGNRAYVALRETGFAILDVSDPLAPTVLSTVTGLGEGEDLGVQGNFVYFARRDDNLMQIYDVSNPVSPVARGSVVMDTPDCMVPDGNVLYAVDRHNNSIRILDITDPDAPFEITSIVLYDDPNEIDKVGDYLYVAEESYMTVVDVSNPAAPFIRASIDGEAGDIDGLQVAGGYAYCADGLGGLLVIDVSDLDNLQKVANVPSRGEGDHISIEGTHLYMAANEAGVQVIDIAVPTAPVHLGYCAVAARAADAVASGGYTFVACHGGGLRVIDQSEPDSTVFADLTDDLLLGTVATGEGNTDVVASGTYAYVAKDDGFSTVSLADPLNPLLVRTDTVGWNSQAIAMQGNLLYIAAEGGGLQIVDVTDPLNPDIKPPFALSDEAQDVAVQGSYAYVADRYGAEFIVVDVTDPDAPVWVGNDGTVVGDSTRSVAVQGDWAYVAWGYTGLYTVDVSDPAHPSLETALELHDVGDTDQDFAHKVVVSGNYAYVIAEELHIVDISNPYSPTLTKTYEIGGDENITVSGDFAVVVQGREGIEVLSVVDPSDPWPLLRLEALGDARSACLHDGLLLVTSRPQGLTVLRAPTGENVP